MICHLPLRFVILSEAKDLLCPRRRRSVLHFAKDDNRIRASMTIHPTTRRLSSTEAAEIAEAALVLPLVFMLLMGIIWFGRAFNIYSTITQAAQQGAITAARASCATCVPSNSFPIDGTVDNAIYAVMRASSLDPTQI